jgi:hypothetical protein
MYTARLMLFCADLARLHTFIFPCTDREIAYCEDEIFYDNNSCDSASSCVQGVAAFLARASISFLFRPYPTKSAAAAFIFNEKVTLKLLCINQKSL